MKWEMILIFDNITKPRRKIYVGFDSPSIIHWVSPKSGVLHKARFQNCQFEEKIFPSLTSPGPSQPLVFADSQIITMNPDPRTTFADFEVRKLLALQTLAEKLLYSFKFSSQIIRNPLPGASQTNSKSFPTGMLVSHCCPNPRSPGPVSMVSSLSLLPWVIQTLSFVLPPRPCPFLFLCLVWRQLLTSSRWRQQRPVLIGPAGLRLFSMNMPFCANIESWSICDQLGHQASWLQADFHKEMKCPWASSSLQGLFSSTRFHSTLRCRLHIDLFPNHGFYYL